MNKLAPSVMTGVMAGLPISSAFSPLELRGLAKIISRGAESLLRRRRLSRKKASKSAARARLEAPVAIPAMAPLEKPPLAFTGAVVSWDGDGPKDDGRVVGAFVAAVVEV